MPTHDCDGASWGSIMTALIFTCPKSGRPIESGIEADRASLSNAQSVKIRVRCPHCWQEHDRMIRDDGHLSGGHTRHLAKPSGIEEAAAGVRSLAHHQFTIPRSQVSLRSPTTITTASRTKRNSRTAFGNRDQALDVLRGARHGTTAIRGALSVLRLAPAYLRARACKLRYPRPKFTFG